MPDAIGAPMPVRRLFLLPGGFPPDTLEFAWRTTAALLLAYLVGFWAQLESASSAAVTVAWFSWVFVSSAHDVWAWAEPAARAAAPTDATAISLNRMKVPPKSLLLGTSSAQLSL